MQLEYTGSRRQGLIQRSRRERLMKLTRALVGRVGEKEATGDGLRVGSISQFSIQLTKHCSFPSEGKTVEKSCGRLGVWDAMGKVRTWEADAQKSREMRECNAPQQSWARKARRLLPQPRRPDRSFQFLLQELGTDGIQRNRPHQLRRSC